VYKQGKLIGGFTGPRSYRGMYGQMSSHWFHVPKKFILCKNRKKNPNLSLFHDVFNSFQQYKSVLPEKSHAI
jgi:hypothetical protein